MFYTDLSKRFHRIAIQQGYPPFARALFDTLLYKFSSQFWIDRIALSQMDLSGWAGLTKKAFQEAQHFLTSRHIIEMQKTKRDTFYSLGEEWKPKKSNVENPAATPNIAQESSDNSTMRNFEPSTNHKSSTKVPQLDLKGAPLARAHAINNYPYIKDFEKKSSIDNQSIDDRARESDSDRAERLWQELGGGRLSIEHLSKLGIYLKAHGLAWVEEAMREASDSNNNPRGIPPKFLFAVFDRKAQAGKKSERRDSMREVEAEYYVAAETKNDFIDYKKYLKGV